MSVRIEHIAIWTPDLERSKDFYVSYFGAEASEIYYNDANGFQSVFLAFGEGTRIEIMQTTTLSPVQYEPGVHRMGLTHIAIAVGSEQIVDVLTQRIRKDGFPILDGPRRTGDGYYESVVLDPDGNRIEITV